MKRCLAYILVVLIIQLPCAHLVAQWQVVPVPTSNSLSAVQFSTADTGFIAAGSSILRTLNGGSTWTSVAVPVEVSALSFPTTQLGWASGDGVLRSVDGGESWNVVPRPGSIADTSYGWGILFDSTGEGVVFGDINAWYTPDGGASWSESNTTADVTPGHARGIVRDPRGGYHIATYLDYESTTCDHYFASSLGSLWLPNEMLWGLGINVGLIPRTIAITTEQRLFIGGQRLPFGFSRKIGARILFSADNGKSWDSTQYMFPYTVNAICFVDSNIGFVGDSAGNIYSTTDGGDTWRNENVPSDGRSINSICVARGSRLYAVGSGGLVLRQELPLSVNDAVVSAKIQLIPNPASGLVRIETDGVPLSLITVVDMLGRTVEIPITTASIDVSSLAAGLYFLVARSEFQFITKPLVVCTP